MPQMWIIAPALILGVIAMVVFAAEQLFLEPLVNTPLDFATGCTSKLEQRHYIPAEAVPINPLPTKAMLRTNTALIHI